MCDFINHEKSSMKKINKLIADIKEQHTLIRNQQYMIEKQHREIRKQQKILIKEIENGQN